MKSFLDLSFFFLWSDSLSQLKQSYSVDSFHQENAAFYEKSHCKPLEEAKLELSYM